MVIKEFSDESVELAKNAQTLGFDIVACTGSYANFRSIVFSSISDEYTISDSKFFPELSCGERFALSYIEHHKEINKLFN